MYFRSLQIMRGLAALAVVLYHVNAYLGIFCNAPSTPFRVFDVNFSHGVWFFFISQWLPYGLAGRQ
jgi:exopolysaccharide production protein ExoZ